MFVKVSVVRRHRPGDFVDFDDNFGSFLDEGGYSLAKQGDKKLSEKFCDCAIVLSIKADRQNEILLVSMPLTILNRSMLFLLAAICSRS